ncbi:MAG TPA: MFS transporter [Candidatus Limnocylindrales bacterium]|nr:MFS transporter [Candidatus Limnocylindrales bacterium]
MPWTPQSWLLRILLLSVVTTAVVQAVRPMASYKVLAVGGSIADVGIVAAAFGFLSLFFAVPIGRWVDRGSESGFMLIGAALMAASAAGTALATSVVVLALCQALLGVGHIGVAVGLQTMISNRGTAADHDSRFGAFAVTQSLGQLIGPAAAGILAANGTPHPTVDVVFIASAFAVLLAAPLALTLGSSDGTSDRDVPTPGTASEGMRTAVRRVIAVPSMRQALLAGIAVVVSNNVLIAYLPAYGVAAGLSVEVVGLLLTLRAGASMASRLLIGRLRSRINRRTLLGACLVAPALALFVVSFRSEVPILFIAMFVVGFGLGLGQPLTLTWIAGRSPKELRGTAVALRLAGNRVGQFTVPATLGVVGGIAGVSAVFWSLGILLILTALAVRTARFVETPLEPG